MNNTKIIGFVTGVTLLSTLGTSTAFAKDDGLNSKIGGISAGISVNKNEGSVHADAQASVSAKNTDKMKDRADQEITRRIDALTKLADRINDMKRVSEDVQSDLHGQITSQASALAALKVKIDNDDSTTTLKSDIQSITDSYRIYMVVMPKLQVLAAVDRINTLVLQMQTVGGKLQTIINAAATSTADVSGAKAALADFNAKVSDATSLSAAAKAEVTPLQPDNGNASTTQSNLSILKDARSKIQTAQQDLVTARKDLNTIRKDLMSWIKTNTTITSTTTTSVH